MNGVEMPKYQSHKQVWALKIETITLLDDGSADIVPRDEMYSVFNVSKGYVDKHKPEEGGYYVQYKDGYQSWSPADAFEAGYSLIKCNVFNFGMAVEYLRIGKKVARIGWNGKGMYLTQQTGYPVNGHLNPSDPDGAYPTTPDGKANIIKHKGGQMLPCILIKVAGYSKSWGEGYSDYVPWLASQTDIFAYDWQIVK